MGEPIKIVLTAETEAAANQLYDFARTQGLNFKQVGQAAQEAGAHMGGYIYQFRSAMDAVRFAAADGGPRAAFYAVDEAIRAVIASGTKLGSLVPYVAAVGAAAAVFGAEWLAVMGDVEDSTAQIKKLNSELNQVPAILEKIQLFAKAGLISPAAAKEFADELNGRGPKKYVALDGTLTDKPTEQVEEQGDAGSGLYGGPPSVHTYTRNVPLKEATQEQINADVTGNKLPNVAEEQLKAAAKARELHEQVLEQTRSERAAIEEKYNREIELIKLTAEQAGKLIGPKAYDEATNSDIAALKQKKADELAAVQARALEEQNRKQLEAVRQVEEDKKKLVTDADLQLNTALENFAEQTTAKTKAYWDAVYQAKYANAKDELDREEISEAEFEKKISDAQKEQQAGYKEINAELQKTALLKQEIARADDEARLKQIQGNPFLTGSQKSAQSVPALSDLVSDNAASQQQFQTLADNAAPGSEAQLEALRQVNELKQQGVELQNQLNAAENADNFNYQLGEIIIKLQNIGTLEQQAAAAFGSVWTTATDSISSNLTKVIEGTETWKKALINIYNSVLNELISSVVKMSVQWILQHTLMAAASRLFHTTDLASHVTTETAKTGATAAGESTRTGISALGSLERKAIAELETAWHYIQIGLRSAAHLVGETLNTAYSLVGAIARKAIVIGELQPYIIMAGIEAAAAVASIPYVGPILAPIAAVATIAGLEALAVFNEGGYTGPGGVMDPAGIVHRGEYVFSAPAVQRLGLGTLDALHNGGSPAAAAAAGGAGAGKVSVYSFLDHQQLANHLERNPDHEKWVVDVVRRNSHLIK